jgi:O-antigen ligase
MSTPIVSESKVHPIGRSRLAFLAMLLVAISIPFGEALRDILGGFSIARVMIPLGFFALMLQTRTPIVHPLTAWALAFYTFCLPSIVIGDSSYLSVTLSFAGYLIMFQVVMGIARTSVAWLERLLIGYAVALGVVTALTLIAQTGGPDFGVLLGWPLLDMRFYPRILGFENNPNGFASHFIVGLPVVLNWILSSRSSWGRIALMALLAVLTIGLILTLSRAAFLGVCLAIGLYWVATRTHIRALAIFGVLTIPFLIWAALSLPSLIVDWFGDPKAAYIADDKVEAVAIRHVMTPIALDIVLNHPITGVGYERFAESLDRRADWPYEWRGNPHNLLLGVAAEFGLLSFSALMGLIIAACGRAWLSTRRANPNLRRVPGLVLGILSGLLFNSLFHYALVNLSVWMLVAMAGGLPLHYRKSIRT